MGQHPVERSGQLDENTGRPLQQHGDTRIPHTELEAVYEEFNMSLTKDIRKELAAIGKMLFPTHPYGTQTTIGT